MSVGSAKSMPLSVSAKKYKPRTKPLPFARPDMSSKEKEAVLGVLDSGWLSSGPQVEKFEKEFARAIGVKRAIALNSCTAALHLAAAAWEFGKKDAVLVPSITFTATAEVFCYSGCLPIILDVDRDTYLFSAELVREFIQTACVWQKGTLIHRKSRRRLRALVPVHLGGRPCDMDALKTIALEYNLKILEDAAHAFPASYKGRPLGSLGDAAAFSFYATKNLSTGEGGMLTTNDENLAKQIQRLRLHGIEGQAYGRKRWHYDVFCEGYKYNMPDICAAIGRVQLQRSKEMHAKRRAIHNFYEEKLNGLPCLRTNPLCQDHDRLSYHLYAVEILEKFEPGRDHFVEEMHRRGIGLSLHFIPLYRFTHYQKKYGLNPKDYPHSESIHKRAVSLPIYSAMSLDDAQDVVSAVKDVFH